MKVICKSFELSKARNATQHKYSSKPPAQREGALLQSASSFRACLKRSLDDISRGRSEPHTRPSKGINRFFSFPRSSPGPAEWRVAGKRWRGSGTCCSPAPSRPLLSRGAGPLRSFPPLGPLQLAEKAQPQVPGRPASSGGTAASSQGPRGPGPPGGGRLSSPAPTAWGFRAALRARPSTSDLALRVRAAGGRALRPPGLDFARPCFAPPRPSRGPGDAPGCRSRRPPGSPRRPGSVRGPARPPPTRVRLHPGRCARRPCSQSVAWRASRAPQGTSTHRRALSFLLTPLRGTVSGRSAATGGREGERPNSPPRSHPGPGRGALTPPCRAARARTRAACSQHAVLLREEP